MQTVELYLDLDGATAQQAEALWSALGMLKWLSTVHVSFAKVDDHHDPLWVPFFLQHSSQLTQIR